MTVLSAQAIRRAHIFEPFVERQLNARTGKTFGLGPCTYDVRVEFDNVGAVARRLMWPGRFLLASTIERFTMPNDCVALVCDKSSWARKGLTVQNTIIDPGWGGYLTLELIYHGWRPFWLHRGAPIAQILVLRLNEMTELPYIGKYQNQRRGPVPPIHEKGKNQ